jgi:hypothetical protein
MNSVNEDEKYISYRKILRIRNICRIIVFVPPFVSLCIGFFVSEPLFIDIIKYIWIPYLIGLFCSVLCIMAINICPWCKQSLFFKSYGMISMAGLGLFSSNRCATCGEPKHEK